MAMGLVVIAGAGTGKTRVIVEHVLPYNVKVTREFLECLDQTVGPATRARIAVSNSHSFCHRILTENAADAGLRPRPGVLDGVVQVPL
ncbi:MAG: UvrD-helicase domain-containing protein [Chloroflexota bacterium]